MSFGRATLRTGAAWFGVCAALAVASVVLWTVGALSAPVAAWLETELVWRATDWPSRPWTLWTASLVEHSWMHLSVNLIALAALAVFGAFWRLPRTAALALLLAWPLSNALLLVWPEVDRYHGVSDLNHALALVCWSFIAINREAKPWSFVLFALIGLKLLAEHAWSRPVELEPDSGHAVVYAANLAGALAGLVCGLGVAMATRVVRRIRAC